jgi:hypothetical protein
VGESFFPISTDGADSVVVDACERGMLVMFVNPTWFSPALAPVEMPIGLSHIDSDFCWCDPIIEVDDDGEEMVLHKQ